MVHATCRLQIERCSDCWLRSRFIRLSQCSLSFDVVHKVVSTSVRTLCVHGCLGGVMAHALKFVGGRLRDYVDEALRLVRVVCDGAFL